MRNTWTVSSLSWIIVPLALAGVEWDHPTNLVPTDHPVWEAKMLAAEVAVKRCNGAWEHLSGRPLSWKPQGVLRLPEGCYEQVTIVPAGPLQLIGPGLLAELATGPVDLGPVTSGPGTVEILLEVPDAETFTAILGGSSWEVHPGWPGHDALRAELGWTVEP